MKVYLLINNDGDSHDTWGVYTNEKLAGFMAEKKNKEYHASSFMVNEMETNDMDPKSPA